MPEALACRSSAEWKGRAHHSPTPLSTPFSACLCDLACVPTSSPVRCGQSLEAASGSQQRFCERVALSEPTRHSQTDLGKRQRGADKEGHWYYAFDSILSPSRSNHNTSTPSVPLDTFVFDIKRAQCLNITASDGQMCRSTCTT